jgi:hypothetical protein
MIKIMPFIHSAIVIFGLTAMVGMYLLSLILRNKTTPKGVSMLHGFFAITGLIILIVYAYLNPPGPLPSIVSFGLAAMGGLFLVYRDVTGKPIPKWLGIVHGFIAITGYILLILYACAMSQLTAVPAGGY